MKAPSTPRELIIWWLDHIKETDPEARKEVINACESNKEMRTFYVGLAKNSWTSYSDANRIGGYQWGVL